MERQNDQSAHLPDFLHSVAITITASFWLRHQQLLSGDVSNYFIMSHLWSLAIDGEAEKYFEAALHFALPAAAKVPELQIVVVWLLCY